MATVTYQWLNTAPSFNLNNTPATLSDNSQPAIAGLSDGSLFGAWTTDGNGSNFDLYGLVVDVSGAPTGNEFILNSTTANGQFDTDVVQLTNGNVVVTFTDYSTDSHGDVRARLFKPTGTPLGGDFQAANSATVAESVPSVAALADGGFVVSFTKGFTGGDNDVP